MSKLQLWWIGLLIIAFFVLSSEFVIIFNSYIFSRLGLNRNIILSLLWLLPAISSFIAAFFSSKNSLLLGLSYIPILSILGPIIHFFSGQLGATVDFGGISGLRITFPIYFVLSVITVGIGSLTGISLKRKK
ncbi:MAG: hypothetical protein AB1568_13595 [Thermodesulfobacteriota bacterium]